VSPGGVQYVQLRPDDLLTVTDVEGGQVGDLFAYVAGSQNEYLSASHTRAVTGTLFPAIGTSFVTNRRRPILSLVRDDSPGIHDMLIAACDPERYRDLGVEGWHASCEENLFLVAGALGLRAIEVCPQPVNLFMNVEIGNARDLMPQPASTKAGDSVTFRANLECLVVVSACPQDLVNINRFRPSPLRLDLNAAAP